MSPNFTCIISLCKRSITRFEHRTKHLLINVIHWWNEIATGLVAVRHLECTWLVSKQWWWRSLLKSRSRYKKVAFKKFPKIDFTRCRKPTFKLVFVFKNLKICLERFFGATFAWRHHTRFCFARFAMLKLDQRNAAIKNYNICMQPALKRCHGKPGEKKTCLMTSL